MFLDKIHSKNFWQFLKHSTEISNRHLNLKRYHCAGGKFSRNHHLASWFSNDIPMESFGLIQNGFAVTALISFFGLYLKKIRSADPVCYQGRVWLGHTISLLKNFPILISDFKIKFFGH